MVAQAASTLAFCGALFHAGSKISRRISTCATLRSNSEKASNTSCAACVAKLVEKTVRQMMSAVRWLIARSSENGASPAASSVASAASAPATMSGKARLTRIIVSDGSIIDRWRDQVAPEETKMLSPISGCSASTIRSDFGKIPSGSASTRRTCAGSLTIRMERRDQPSQPILCRKAAAGSRLNRSPSPCMAKRMSDMRAA